MALRSLSKIAKICNKTMVPNSYRVKNLKEHQILEIIFWNQELLWSVYNLKF